MKSVPQVLMLAVLLAGGLPASASGQAPSGSREQLHARDEAARRVLLAIVRAAEQNQRLARPLEGDALTSYYVREAARTAAGLPEEEGVPALLLGLGLGLDTSSLMRQSPLTGPLWRRVEDEPSRKARLAVLGKPTLYGRYDWAQHFFVSAALSALVGCPGAESLGLLKEQLDMRAGGSGFSFADLAADYAGVALAGRLQRKEVSLGELGRTFRVEAAVPRLNDLEEGLTPEALARKFGSFQDPRFLDQVALIRKRIREAASAGGPP